MMTTSNGRDLLVTDIESVTGDLGTDWVPFVVLLTAWSISDLEEGRLSSELIKLLLTRGTEMFVCIGDHSEILHDKIDKIIYEFDDEQNIELSEVITTYHADESIEDAVEFFVYATMIPASRNCGLLAIIGPDDKTVKECLKKACSSVEFVGS